MQAFADFADDYLIGMGNVTPKIQLVGGSPQDIQETIYHKAPDGTIHHNRWRTGVGYNYVWRDGGRYSYGLTGADPGYYFFNKQTYQFDALGLSWQEASTALIARKKAAKVSNNVPIDQLIKDEMERRKPKPKPNRNPNVQWGVNAAILQDMKDNSRL